MSVRSSIDDARMSLADAYHASPPGDLKRAIFQTINKLDHCWDLIDPPERDS